MEPAVTPELALRYLRELSADLIAAAVAHADGRPLAGRADLASAGAELLASARTGSAHVALEVRTPGTVVVAGRSTEHVVVAVHTEHALPGLVMHDVLTVLGDLATVAPPPDDAVARDVVDGTHALAEAVRRVVAGVDPAPQRAFARPDADP